MSAGEGYGLGSHARDGVLGLPELSFGPPPLIGSSPRIGLIGCGGISEQHLAAYRRMGLEVVALCNRDVSKADARAAQFYPKAQTFSRHEDLLAHADVEVVDVATHPAERLRLIREALLSGRHVLSQKPFALDLDEVQPLVRLAAERGLCLAVNQNGRWAPHLGAMRSLVESGVIGELREVEVSIRWDHSWTVGTSFDRTPFLVLFDFGIHWFDFVATLTEGREFADVRAEVGISPGQRSPQPMIAAVELSGPGLSVRMRFDGDSPHLQRDITFLKGSEGAVVSEGPDLLNQRVRVCRSEGSAEVLLDGDWFTTGFEGAMAELLCAVRDGRQPSHSAQRCVGGLELAFAACESANLGEPVRPGAVRSLPAPRRPS